MIHVESFQSIAASDKDTNIIYTNNNSILARSTINASTPTTVISQHGTLHLPNNYTVLLSIALVHGPKKKVELGGALLDSVSQLHFITSSLARRLGLHRVAQNIVVKGVYASSVSISETANVQISSRITNKKFSLTTLLIPNITVKLPTTPVDGTNGNQIKDIPLRKLRFPYTR